MKIQSTLLAIQEMQIKALMKYQNYKKWLTQTNNNSKKET